MDLQCTLPLVIGFVVGAAAAGAVILYFQPNAPWSELLQRFWRRSVSSHVRA